nr:hypothetical protein Iba_scaffold1681463CG0010 [Ipomoea batatas]
MHNLKADNILRKGFHIGLVSHHRHLIAASCKRQKRLEVARTTIWSSITASKFSRLQALAAATTYTSCSTVTEKATRARVDYTMTTMANFCTHRTAAFGDCQITCVAEVPMLFHKITATGNVPSSSSSSTEVASHSRDAEPP